MGSIFPSRSCLCACPDRPGEGLRSTHYVFDPRFEALMLDRHEANAELIRGFLDDPEVSAAFTSWARQESYRRIRDQEES